MSQFPRLPTGVPGLDESLYGGIPRGRATLITGRSGACKSILSLQISCNLARAGERVLFVSTEERPEDLIMAGDDLGFETGRWVSEKRLRLMDLIQPLSGPMLVSGSIDLTGLINRMGYYANEAAATVIVLDSISAMFSPLPPSPALRHQFFQLVYALADKGRTVIVTAEAPSDYGQLAMLGLEDFICDLVIVLRNVVDGKRRRRSMEVHKYRRSNHFKGEYPFALTRRGVSVFPLDVMTEKLREGSELVERYPSGIAGLDEMTGGGWLRDSIVLVRGPTGSGKTTLAGMYALAGAHRGERVFYYGFEETETILRRNFQSLGLPVNQFIEQGLLKLIARFPEATSPEDMLIELRTVLDEHKPSLIVLDSISAFEHVSSYEIFRQLMIGIASALRQHGRSALLTQTVAQHNIADLGAPYLSTMADAILLLNYQLDTPEFVRQIRVLKMRGSPHSTRPRSLSIEQGGIVVGS